MTDAAAVGGFHKLVFVRVQVILFKILLRVRKSAAFEPDSGIRAEGLHADLDVLAYVPLRAVAHARVQLLRPGNGAQVGDDPAASLRAPLSSEQLPAVEEVIPHGGPARHVHLALQPGLGAAHGAGARQARLDGQLGAAAHRVHGAVAVLQSRAGLGEVELDQGGYTVAGTLLSFPADDGRARVQILVVRVMALRLSLTLEDGFPADQPVVGVVVGGSDAHTDREDARAANQGHYSLHQCVTTCRFVQRREFGKTS